MTTPASKPEHSTDQHTKARTNPTGMHILAAQIHPERTNTPIRIKTPPPGSAFRLSQHALGSHSAYDSHSSHGR